MRFACIDVDAGAMAAQRFDARAHVRQADAGTARRRPIRIAGILDHEFDEAIAPPRTHVNLATFEQMRDAVMYGMMPSANTASWVNAPPENRLMICAAPVAADCSISCRSAPESTPGVGMNDPSR